MYQIMIIEDEPEIREELVLLLENEGYRVIAPAMFSDVLSQIEEKLPQLILLDLNLPGQDGFSLCKTIRNNVSVPIVFVTSRDSAMDELKALSLGGDDYITKPYNIPVLLARIKAVLRRSGEEKEHCLQWNGLTLDCSRGLISYQENRCEITKNEMKILSCLMHTPGEILSRADLIESLWDNQIYIDDNTLSVNMTRLRGKLSELGLQDYITTKRGMGYKI